MEQLRFRHRKEVANQEKVIHIFSFYRNHRIQASFMDLPTCFQRAVLLFGVHWSVKAFVSDACNLEAAALEMH